MRIALVTETFLPHIDGIVTRLIRTLEALQEAGDKMLVVAPRARGLPSEYCDARVVGAPSIPLPVYPNFRLGLPLIVGLDTTLANFAPDIIHAVSPILLGMVGLSYARRHRVPLIASYHAQIPTYAQRYGAGVFEPLLWWYMRALHNQAQINLCTSHPVLAQLRERGFQRLQLWAPGVDTALFAPHRRTEIWRERLLGGRSDATLLLYVGRLAKEKALESLAPALAALPGCHLALVGEGPAERKTATGLRGSPRHLRRSPARRRAGCRLRLGRHLHLPFQHRNTRLGGY